MSRLMGGAARLLERFTRSQKGNVAMMAGIAVPVLLMISAGAIDLHNAAKVKSELQDALDAATLAAARSSTTNPAEIQNIGMASLRANMPKYFELNGGDVAEFKLDSRFKVESKATVQVKTIVANVFLPPYGKLFDDYLPMSANSQVLRASRNVEVALALDVTGSMDKFMGALRDAAEELVGIVVQGDQELFTTKVALIPYAAGVNMGTEARATALRGSLTGPTAITRVTRLEDAQYVDSINNINKEITLYGHRLQSNDVVLMQDFRSSADVNGNIYQVDVVNENVFKIRGVSPSYADRFGNVTKGKVSKCITRTCDMVATSVNHGLQDLEYVHVSGVGSSVGVNTADTNIYQRINRNDVHVGQNVTRIRYVDQDRFVVPSTSTSITDNWSSTSSSKAFVQCGRDGCLRRYFENKVGSTWRHDNSTCVSERPRGNASPSDRPASSGNWLGRVYIDNTCPKSPFVPLTNDRSTLSTAITALSHGGSTAGQVGVEMAWYAISPNFGAINGVSPRPFNSQETVKAVVLMTDGEFNIPFCQGVIARDALVDGSGDDRHKINCDGTNGNAFKQAYDTCLAMKAQGIVVYAVAFNLKDKKVGGAVDTAYEVMRYCATDPDENFFDTSTGGDLKEAFKQIGRDITRLRIAR